MLYRNGIGELFQNINSTVLSIEQNNNEIVDSIHIFALVMLVFMIFFTFMTVISLLIPPLVILQRSKELAWYILLQTPIDICKEIKEEFMSKLESYGEDTAQKSLVISSIADMESTNLVNHADRHKRINFRSSRVLLVFQIIIFCAVNFAVVYIQYYLGFQLTEDELRMQSLHFNWTTRRLQLVREINF